MTTAEGYIKEVLQNMPSATPPIMIVAGPVSACSASFFVGVYSSLVAYSVHLPISQPATSPTMMLNATPGMPNIVVPGVRGMSQYDRPIAATTTSAVERLMPRASALSKFFCVASSSVRTM